MPYIDPERRKFLAATDRINDTPKNAGELNFCISTMILRYMREKGLRYQHINDVVGALEGAKAEFQRLVVGPYEDQKILENGGIGYEEFVEGDNTYVVDIEAQSLSASEFHGNSNIFDFPYLKKMREKNYGYNDRGEFDPTDNGQPNEAEY